MLEKKKPWLKEEGILSRWYKSRDDLHTELTQSYTVGQSKKDWLEDEASSYGGSVGRSGAGASDESGGSDDLRPELKKLYTVHRLLPALFAYRCALRVFISFYIINKDFSVQHKRKRLLATIFCLKEIERVLRHPESHFLHSSNYVANAAEAIYAYSGDKIDDVTNAAAYAAYAADGASSIDIAVAAAEATTIGANSGFGFSVFDTIKSDINFINDTLKDTSTLTDAEFKEFAKDFLYKKLWGETVPEKILFVYGSAQKQLEHDIQNRSLTKDEKIIFQHIQKVIQKIIGKTQPDIQHVPPKSLYDDRPSKTDHLGRNKIRKVVTNFLSSNNNHGNYVIGLFGNWGTGKSSFLEQLSCDLKEQNNRGFLFGIFDADEYERMSCLDSGITDKLIKLLVHSDPLGEGSWKVSRYFRKISLKWGYIAHKYGTQIKSFFTKLCWSALFGGMSVGAYFLSPDIGKMLTEIYKNASPYFQYMAVGCIIALPFLPFTYGRIPFFKDISVSIKKSLKITLGFKNIDLPDYKNSLGLLHAMRDDIRILCNLRLNDQLKLVFIIDNLDRCSPESIFNILKSVKLAMNLKNVFVIISAEDRFILSSVAQKMEDYTKHSHFDTPNECARDYLDKLIQLSLRLPDVTSDDIKSMLQKIWNDKTDFRLINDFPLTEFRTIPHQETENIHKTEGQQKERPSEEKQVQGKDNQEEKGQANKAPSMDEIIQTLLAHIKREERENEDKKEVVNNLSVVQKEAIYYWLVVFNLSNPRQIKRILSSYNMAIDAIMPEGGDIEPSFPVLVILCVWEYLYSEYGQDNNLHQAFEKGTMVDYMANVPEEYKEKYRNDKKLVKIQEVSKWISGYDKSILHKVKCFTMPSLPMNIIYSN